VAVKSPVTSRRVRPTGKYGGTAVARSPVSDFNIAVPFPDTLRQKEQQDLRLESAASNELRLLDVEQLGAALAW
jgi:hypothetical protein